MGCGSCLKVSGNFSGRPPVAIAISKIKCLAGTFSSTVKSRPIAHGRLAFRAPLTRGWAIAREFQFYSFDNSTDEKEMWPSLSISHTMSVYMYLKINALGDYKKKYDPFARLLALKRGVGVCSVVGVVSGFYGSVKRARAPCAQRTASVVRLRANFLFFCFPVIISAVETFVSPVNVAVPKSLLLHWGKHGTQLVTCSSTNKRRRKTVKEL